MSGTNILTAILAVFTQIGDWIIEQLGAMMPLFWDNNSLTFLGVLAVCSLGVGFIFLLIGIIQRFLHFRG